MYYGGLIITCMRIKGAQPVCSTSFVDNSAMKDFRSTLVFFDQLTQ